jgi:hypothetical protein
LVTVPVTPYGLAAFLNAALKAALGGNAKEVSTQEMYMAVRNGSLKVSKFDSGHKKVTPEEGNRYIKARVERAVSKQTPKTEAVAS